MGVFMSKRYGKTLKEHIELAETHANLLVKRLAFHANRAKYLQNKGREEEAQKTYIKMYEITEELRPVESWVKASWPQISELYDAIRSAKVENEEN
jgi:uncharacterized protein YllA (UPF0747 family)